VAEDDAAHAADPSAAARVTRVGLISDTHGKLDPRAVDIFRREAVAHIIHAGDVGKPAVLWELETVAPVTAVLGNTDHDPALGLGITAQVEIAGVRIAVVHEPVHAGQLPPADVIVVGHTHRPDVHWLGRTLVVNPGSAFRPRSDAGRTLGVLEIGGGGDVQVRVVGLE